MRRCRRRGQRRDDVLSGNKSRSRSATCGPENFVAGRRGVCPPAGSILSEPQETGAWGGKPRSGGGGILWWLSHLVKLSLWNISIRKGVPSCLGLSPCNDRVHKCGQAQGIDSVGYHSCHSARAGPPPLPTLLLAHCFYFHTMSQ